MNHLGEDLHPGVRIKRPKVPYMTLSDECLSTALQIVDVMSVTGFQFIGIDVIIAVSDGLATIPWPNRLPAFIQYHVDIVRVKDAFPESRPVRVAPNIEVLVIS